MASIRAQVDKSTMHNNDLRKAISDLAANKSDVYGKPIKVDGQVDQAFGLVLAEIGQTVLPRSITLDCQPVGKIILKVSHRRLFECDVAGQTVSGATQSSDDLRALAQEFVTVLREFFAGSQTITLFPPTPIEAIVDSSMSCSAQILGDVAGAEPAGKVYESSAMSDIARLKNAAQAWRLTIIEESRTETQGSKADQDLVEAVSRVIFPESGAQTQAHFRKGKDAYFFCPLDNGSVICAAQTPTLQFVALVSEIDMGNTCCLPQRPVA